MSHKKIENLTLHARSFPYTGTVIDVTRAKFIATPGRMTVRDGSAPTLPIDVARKVTGRSIPDGTRIDLESK